MIKNPVIESAEDAKELYELAYHYYNAAVETEHKVQEIIGGYLYGYSEDGLPLWGDHVAESLAQEIVNTLRQVMDLQCNIK